MCVCGVVICVCVWCGDLCGRYGSMCVCRNTSTALIGLISCQQEDVNIQAISAIREIGPGCAAMETFVD